MKAQDNKCPACSANIAFNPKNQTWDCAYCGSKFTLEEMQKYENASSEKNNLKVSGKKLEGFDSYHCQNCGAEVMADETTTATFCVYCGSTTILKEKIMDGIAPAKVLPFKKTKEDAINAFLKLSKGRPLMPKLFNNPENIEKISGVYIPFWSFNMNVAGKIDFLCTDVTSWVSGDYRYTKTDQWLCKRSCDLNYNSILADGSSRFADDLMDSLEPFQLNELEEYNHAYLSGFLAEKYDLDSGQVSSRASARAMNTSVSEVRKTVLHGITSATNNTLKVQQKGVSYYLLPVWMVNIKYKDKNYTFAMNGQTGKMIGNIPIEIPKVILFSVLIFLLSFGIIFFILEVA